MAAHYGAEGGAAPPPAVGRETRPTSPARQGRASPHARRHACMHVPCAQKASAAAGIPQAGAREGGREKWREGGRSGGREGGRSGGREEWRGGRGERNKTYELVDPPKDLLPRRIVPERRWMSALSARLPFPLSPRGRPTRTHLGRQGYSVSEGSSRFGRQLAFPELS